MSPRRKSQATDNSALSFEDAMEELESIVEAMEGEQLPLDELVTRYEEGSALLKHCTSALASAKKRIELITLEDRPKGGRSNGAETTELPGTEPQQDSDDHDDSNDISLF